MNPPFQSQQTPKQAASEFPPSQLFQPATREEPLQLPSIRQLVNVPQTAPMMDYGHGHNYGPEYSQPQFHTNLSYQQAPAQFDYSLPRPASYASDLNNVNYSHPQSQTPALSEQQRSFSAHFYPQPHSSIKQQAPDHHLTSVMPPSSMGNGGPLFAPASYAQPQQSAPQTQQQASVHQYHSQLGSQSMANSAASSYYNLAAQPPLPPPPQPQPQHHSHPQHYSTANTHSNTQSLFDLADLATTSDAAAVMNTHSTAMPVDVPVRLPSPKKPWTVLHELPLFCPKLIETLEEHESFIQYTKVMKKSDSADKKDLMDVESEEVKEEKKEEKDDDEKAEKKEDKEEVEEEKATTPSKGKDDEPDDEVAPYVTDVIYISEFIHSFGSYLYIDHGEKQQANDENDSVADAIVSAEPSENGDAAAVPNDAENTENEEEPDANQEESTKTTNDELNFTKQLALRFSSFDAVFHAIFTQSSLTAFRHLVLLILAPYIDKVYDSTSFKNLLKQSVDVNKETEVRTVEISLTSAFRITEYNILEVLRMFLRDKRDELDVFLLSNRKELGLTSPENVEKFLACFNRQEDLFRSEVIPSHYRLSCLLFLIDQWEMDDAFDEMVEELSRHILHVQEDLKNDSWMERSLKIDQSVADQQIESIEFEIKQLNQMPKPEGEGMKSEGELSPEERIAGLKAQIEDWKQKKTVAQKSLETLSEKRKQAEIQHSNIEEFEPTPALQMPLYLTQFKLRNTGLGNDRYGQTYWIFPSLRGVFRSYNDQCPHPGHSFEPEYFQKILNQQFYVAHDPVDVKTLVESLDRDNSTDERQLRRAIEILYPIALQTKFQSHKLPTNYPCSSSQSTIQQLDWTEYRKEMMRLLMWLSNAIFRPSINDKTNETYSHFNAAYLKLIDLFSEKIGSFEDLKQLTLDWFDVVNSPVVDLTVRQRSRSKSKQNLITLKSETVSPLLFCFVHHSLQELKITEIKSIWNSLSNWRTVIQESSSPDSLALAITVLEDYVYVHIQYEEKYQMNFEEEVNYVKLDVVPEIAKLLEASSTAELETTPSRNKRRKKK